MSRLRIRRAVAAIVFVLALLWVAAASGALFDRQLKFNLFQERPAADGPAPIGKARLVHTLGNPASSDLPQWPGLIDAAPTAYDIDGDGVDEILAHSNDTNVYVFDALSGHALATIPTHYPGNWYIERVLNSPVAARLAPDAPASVVVTNHAAYVSVWQHAPGDGDADTFVFEQMWERRMKDCFWAPGMDAPPVLGDLDGDGTLEIVVQTEEVGLFALRADGNVLWHKCWAGGNSAPLITDLDGDAVPEVVFASDSGFISVLDGPTGEPEWTFDAADPQYGVTPASVSVAPVAAEIDGQAPKELLFTARNAPSDDPEDFRRFHMAIFAVHQDAETGDGALLWVKQPRWAHPLSYTHLEVRDVDGDGSPDIFGMDWNTIGHSPGNWEPLGLAHVFRLTADGDEVWMRRIDAWWSNKDIALGDFDRDGRYELLVNGAHEGRDGLWRLSAENGNPTGFLSAWPWKLMRGPELFDLRHDGALQLVFPVAPDDSTVSRRAPNGVTDVRGAVLLFELASPDISSGENPR